MKARPNALSQLRFLFRIPENFVPFAFDSPTPKAPILKLCRYWTNFASAASPLGEALDEKVTIEEVGDCPKDSRDVLRIGGCSDSEISKISQRRPSMRNVDHGNLQSKLNQLIGVGFTSSDLVISCYPLDEKVIIEEIQDCPKDSTDVLRKWGCSDSDISQIFHRQPSLRNADLANLQSKLNLLSGLGFTSSDLVRIINCRPRFLSSRLNHYFDERLEYLQELFGSREVLLKAITRNPSLLTYDFHNKIKPVIATYEEVGVRKKDLIPMLLSRPTLIPRTSLNNEKLDYIRKTGISKDSKMYKYVVTLIAISRIETIHEKLANFEKFGFSDDEVFGLFGRSPLVLTLSIDKVQRNMTFILGTMKLAASVVLNHPFLLFFNLEAVLKPRVLLAGKIQDMGLVPQIKGPALLTALRMKEKRFVKAFVKCHPKDVADELMEFYTNAKCVKRLAESSKKTVHKGFPF